jgi:hypothetical protein
MLKIVPAGFAIIVALGSANAATLLQKTDSHPDTTGHLCVALWLPSEPKPGIQKSGAKCFVQGPAEAGSPCTCEGHAGHVIVPGGSSAKTR